VFSTCFEHPSVHLQEVLYMQFYDISFMHPEFLYGCVKEIPYNCMYNCSWGWTLGCSKHVEDTIIKLKHYCKKCVFCWFLLQRFTTVHGSKKRKVQSISYSFSTRIISIMKNV